MDDEYYPGVFGQPIRRHEKTFDFNTAFYGEPIGYRADCEAWFSSSSYNPQCNTSLNYRIYREPRDPWDTVYHQPIPQYEVDFQREQYELSDSPPSSSYDDTEPPIHWRYGRNPVQIPPLTLQERFGIALTDFHQHLIVYTAPAIYNWLDAHVPRIARICAIIESILHLLIAIIAPALIKVLFANLSPLVRFLFSTGCEIAPQIGHGVLCLRNIRISFDDISWCFGCTIDAFVWFFGRTQWRKLALFFFICLLFVFNPLPAIREYVQNEGYDEYLPSFPSIPNIKVSFRTEKIELVEPEGLYYVLGPEVHRWTLAREGPLAVRTKPETDWSQYDDMVIDAREDRPVVRKNTEIEYVEFDHDMFWPRRMWERGIRHCFH